MKKIYMIPQMAIHTVTIKQNVLLGLSDTTSAVQGKGMDAKADNYSDNSWNIWGSDDDYDD